MKKADIMKVLLVLTVVGVLFSGYLTYYTFATGHAACELFFFGMPSCFYGLIMYVLVFLFAFILSINAATQSRRTIAMALVAVVGIIFATTLTTYVMSAVSCTKLDILGIPPCVYGLTMYLILLILTVLETKSKK
jgi:hypothetical protein